MVEKELILGDDLPVSELLALSEHDHVDRLKIQSNKTITTDVTRLLLRGVKSIGTLSIWQTMTRTALRDCFALPNLHTLETRELTTPGKVVGASKATNLHVVRSDYLTPVELSIFSRLPKLEEIRAHNSTWTVELLERFANKSTLKICDIEASTITDEMIAVIAQSKTITELAVGGSWLTGKGLASIAQMQQLEALDIWGAAVEEADLSVLKQLENLTYLAIGGDSDGKRFNAKTLIPLLLSLPSLKNIWLDNIAVDDTQLKVLERYFESVRHDYYPF